MVYARSAIIGLVHKPRALARKRLISTYRPYSTSANTVIKAIGLMCDKPRPRAESPYKAYRLISTY